MIVLDTDVLIGFLRGHAADVELLDELGADKSVRTTCITAVELMVGARGRRDRAAIEIALERLRPLPLGEGASRLAGEVGRELRRRGQGIGMADTLIAGICLAHDAELPTRNPRHFERVPGLALLAFR